MERVIHDYQNEGEYVDLPEEKVVEVEAPAANQIIKLYRGNEVEPEVYNAKWRLSNKSEMWLFLKSENIPLDDGCAAMVEPPLQTWIERYTYMAFTGGSRPLVYTSDFNVALGPDEYPAQVSLED